MALRRPRSIRGLVMAIGLGFAVVAALLGLATYEVVHEEIENQINSRIQTEADTLLDVYRTGELGELIEVIQTREAVAATHLPDEVSLVDRTMGYILVDAAGRRLAGSLQAQMPQLGWSEFVDFQRPDGTQGIAQALNTTLPSGGRLLVAADREIVDKIDMALLKIFAVDFGVILLVGAVAAAVLGKLFQGRLEAIQTSAEAIMAGDLRRRMPLDGSGGEFDQLSAVLNRMLERISELMENLRQVSSDIAHDLRTPLGRLRAQVETAQAAGDPNAVRPALDKALGQADDLMALLTSLLAISEIEGQTARERFVELDLAQAARELAEAYVPAVEAGGGHVALDLEPVRVRGDLRLLQRCLSNLFDNALAHAGVGVSLTLSTGLEDGTAVLRLSDDGPGVPEAQKARIFERFVRLDATRSGPGHGLGLSIVKAVIAAHHGEIVVEPGAGGVAFTIRLPAV